MSSQSLRSSGLLKASLANKRRKIRNESSINSVSTITDYFATSADETSSNSSDKSRHITEIEIPTNEKRKSLPGFDDSFDLFLPKKESGQVKSEEDRKSEEGTGKVNFPKKKAKGGEEGKGDGLPGGVCPVCYEEAESRTHYEECCLEHGLSPKSLLLLLTAHEQYVASRLSLGLPLPSKNHDPVFKKCSAFRSVTCSVSSPTKVSNSFPSNGKLTGYSKKARYLLLRRSQEERESILSKKLAIILMENCSQSIITSSFSSVKENSEYIARIRKTECPLWQMAQAVSSSSCFEDAYITDLFPYIVPTTKSSPPRSQNANMKLNNEEMSTYEPAHKSVPSSQELPSSQDSSLRSRSQPLFNQQPIEVISSQNSTTSVPGRLESKTGHQLENHLEKDWAALFESSLLSDVLIKCDETEIPAHSLVFFVRCPLFYNFVISKALKVGSHLNLKWEVSPVVGKAFLKFLYSGLDNEDEITSLGDEDLRSLSELCNRFHLNSLRNHVEHALTRERGFTRSPDIFLDDYFPDTHLDHAESNLSCDTSVKSNFVSDENQTVPSELPGSGFTDCVENINDVEMHFDGRNEPQQFENVEDRSSGTDRDSDSVVVSRSARREERERKNSQMVEMEWKEIGFSCSGPVSVSSESRSSEVVACDPPGEDLDVTQQFLSTTPSPSPHGCQPETNLHNSSLSLPPRGPTSTLNSSPDANNRSIYSMLTPSPPKHSTSSQYESNSRPDNHSSHSPLVFGDVSSKPKNSLDKYFDNDSFPVNSSLLDVVEGVKEPPGQVKTLGQSTPSNLGKQSSFSTPTAQVLISDKVTPMPNYSTLISPCLKEELKKYGLKPDMERRKAKMLLRYIYDQIHPLLPTTSVTDSKETEEHESQASLSNEIISQDMNEDIIISSDSSESENNMFFDNHNSSDDSTDDRENSTESYKSKPDLLKAVSSYIKQNEELYESILRYTPVWLDKFKNSLKESDIKCKKTDLMDVLDELCITFRTEKKEKNKRKPKWKSFKRLEA